MSLLPEPAPDFSDPIGMLKACHLRMLEHCELLEKIDAHIQTNGLDKEAVEAAQKAYRYFSTAAHHHHMDEEEDIFPWVPDFALLDELLAQHKIINELWEALEPALSGLAEGENCNAFGELIKPFVATYREHIEIEDTQVIPKAAFILNSEQLKEIGQHMQERRA